MRPAAVMPSPASLLQLAAERCVLSYLQAAERRRDHDFLAVFPPFRARRIIQESLLKVSARCQNNFMIITALK